MAHLEVVQQRKPRRFRDNREAPRYTVAEVARYLHIPESTLRAWFFGQSGFEAFLVPADPDRKLLSFYDLVEAHALSWAKHKYRFRPSRLRHALEYVRKEFPQYERPLITKRFSTDGKFLFVQDLGNLESPRPELSRAPTVNASKSGQLLLPSLDEVLELIVYDESDLAKLVYPTGGHGVVAIDPAVSSGRPVVRDTGVLASIIYQRIKKAGEPIERIAKDYGIEHGDIQAALDYIEAA